MEAARSLGMTYVQAMRYVGAAPGVRVILPPVGQRVRGPAQGFVTGLGVGRGRPDPARPRVHGPYLYELRHRILVALCYLVMTLFSSRAVEFIEAKTKFER
jgi:polar amino acid transport system permease protein